jgi:hypothetical protein
VEGATLGVALDAEQVVAAAPEGLVVAASQGVADLEGQLL